MFKRLSERLTLSINKLRGIGKLTEPQIKKTLQEVRKALLEADVALPVIDRFTQAISEKATGQEIIGSVRPGDAFIKLVEDEIAQMLGGGQAELNLKAQPPVVFLMAGLQGSGKTTTTAKLAKHLKEQGKKVMVVSVDIYRPAAIEQLKTLAEQIDVDYFPSTVKDKPKNTVKAALKHAKKQFIDIVLIDTAGRLHIDTELMQELQDLHDLSQPTETLLVVDSMAGQDAANVAKTFNESLTLTGIILTKADGDARGGAALSMREITGKPIKFLGVGEKIDALEPFHPERMASRILGMGDIVSLVEEAERKVDKKKADKIAKKIQKGKRFDFNDFLSQLEQMKKMGGMKSMLDKLPGGLGGKMPLPAKNMLDDKLMVKMEAIIQSMTKKEKQFPALLNGSRKKRIANGSGTQMQDVNKLLKQFTQMQKMLKKFKGNKMQKQLKQMQHQLPPDLLGKLPPMDD